MGLRIKSIIVTFLMLINFFAVANAAWEGPFEIISGGWGNRNTEFGFRSGDTKDQFPENILILSDGKIIIEDWVNNRFKIYQPDGTYLKSITQLGLGLYELDSDRVVSFDWDDQVKNERVGVFSISQGNWLWVDRNRIFDSALAVVGVANNNIIIWDGKRNAYTYSPTGALLRTTTERPLELGRVKEKKTATGYTYTIQYPDLVNPNNVKTYTVSRQYPCSNYTRDRNGNLYCIGDNGVIRFDEQGNEIASVIIPESSYQEIPRGPGVEPKIKVIAQYGEPIISPTGDVYTWKRTPDRYSIIKWTWR